MELVDCPSLIKPLNAPAASNFLFDCDRHGGAFKSLKVLLRHKLVHHESKKYDGYRLTNLGYDYLAIKALVNRGAIAGVGRQIGVGKEADVYEVRSLYVRPSPHTSVMCYTFYLAAKPSCQGLFFLALGVCRS